MHKGKLILKSNDQQICSNQSRKEDGTSLLDVFFANQIIKKKLSVKGADSVVFSVLGPESRSFHLVQSLLGKKSDQKYKLTAKSS